MPPYTGPLWSSLKPEGGNSCWWGDRGRVMASFLKRISAEKCNRITETHYAESEEPQTSCFFFRRIFLLGSIFSVCEISGIPANKNSTFKRSKFREVLLNSKGHQSHLNHRFFVKFFGPNSKKSRDSLGFYTGIWFVFVGFPGPMKIQWANGRDVTSPWDRSLMRKTANCDVRQPSPTGSPDFYLLVAGCNMHMLFFVFFHCTLKSPATSLNIPSYTINTCGRI